MNTKPYDQAFKYLAEQEADALLHLLGVIRPDEQAHVEMLPREISGRISSDQCSPSAVR